MQMIQGWAPRVRISKDVAGIKLVDEFVPVPCLVAWSMEPLGLVTAFERSRVFWALAFAGQDSTNGTFAPCLETESRKKQHFPCS